MPSIQGVPVSNDVYLLNQHHVTGTKQPKRTAVKVWANERAFQTAVIKAASYEALRRPEYGALFHIANENAHRQPGVRGGVPDLFLPVPRSDGDKHNYHGLFIELKVLGGQVSDKQYEWIKLLREQSFFVDVIYDDLDKVMNLLEWYLNLGR